MLLILKEENGLFLLNLSARLFPGSSGSFSITLVLPLDAEFGFIV